MLRYETESIEQEKTHDDFTVEITDLREQTKNGLRMSVAPVLLALASRECAVGQSKTLGSQSTAEMTTGHIHLPSDR